MNKKAIGQNRVSFLGAAREVTGSCHLIETAHGSLLLDCGMHQGRDSIRRLKQEGFDFDPDTIDYVILSHAHLDHSGLLPLLVNQGFDGKIFCTPATAALLKILLEDSFHIYQKDLEYENKRLQRAGKKLHKPIYTLDDVQHALKLVKAVDYEKTHAINSGLSLSFHDAGHILGSSIVQLRIETAGSSRKLVFTGDLGNPRTALLPDPVSLESADLVIMESTYGDRNHRCMEDSIEELVQVIEAAEKSGGNIMIPAFAVGRTQELLFQLGKLYHQGLLKKWVVCLDTPMGKAVTDTYTRFMRDLDPADTAFLKQQNAKNLADFLPNLIISESVEDSIAINRIKQGAIIIAGSGMCTGGRIRHHFKHRLWSANNHVVLVGYQAQGTLGRLLVDGVKTVQLFGQRIAVKARIHTIGGFSAHAGQGELLEWAGAFACCPRFFLVHGEEKSLEALQIALREQRGIEATIPDKGESFSF